MKALAAEESLTWNVAAVAMLCAGVLLCFAGHSMFYLSLAIIGFTLGYVTFFGATCGLSGSVIAATAVGLVGAILVVYFFTKYEKFSIALLGGAGGFTAYLFPTLSSSPISMLLSLPHIRATLLPWWVSSLCSSVQGSL